MTTPVYITGFEHGINPSTNGLGLWNSVNGSPVVDNSIKRTGSYSLKTAPTGAGAHNCRHDFGTTLKVSVGTFYFLVPTGGLPSASTICAGFTFATYSGTAGLYISTSGEIRAQVGTGSDVGSTALTYDVWHRVDYRIDISTSTWTLEWYLDGVQQSNATWAGQPTTDTVKGIRFGSANSTASLTMYFDDAIVSNTSGDYPIGDFGVEALVPSADGTHNAGTNVIEAQDGTDIGATTAYDKINSIPPSATNYIRQAANGSGSYAEVLFNDLSTPHSSIIGAFGVLSYTSETTLANNGACVISKDGFSTKTPIWGDVGAQADYSDGSTSNLYYKSALIDGVVDDTTANALSARVGYSGDANPDPYWIDLIVELAYVPSSSISLDLVTYTRSYPTLNVTEQIPISLDLVTYTSTFNDIIVTENIPIFLDLVTYSDTINDVTILENIVVPLDLVTYSDTINDVTILENIVVPLDLVAYSDTINDITLVSDIPIDLDLVTYSLTVNDVTILENEVIHLDLVTYSSAVNDLDLTEAGQISLDLVTYSISIYDLTVIENEIVHMDLVDYSSVFPDIQLQEAGTIPLDLVTFSNTMYDVLFESESIIADVPFKRTSIAERVDRKYGIRRQDRTVSVDYQDRTFKY